MSYVTSKNMFFIILATICESAPIYDKEFRNKSDLLKCKNVRNGNTHFYYDNDEPICKCQPKDDVDAVDMEKMQKHAKSLGIQLRITKSRPDEEKKNRVIKRHIAEKVGIVKPFSLTTPSDESDAPNTKTIVKPVVAPLDIKGSAKNTKLLLEQAQERIKKLKERTQQQWLQQQQLVFPPSIARLNANELEASKLNESKVISKNTHTIIKRQTLFHHIGDAVQRTHARVNEFLGGNGESLKNNHMQFIPDIAKPFVPNMQPQHPSGMGHSQGEIREETLFQNSVDAPRVDSTIIRPIDFIPDIALPFIPPIPAVMGKPPLAPSDNVEIIRNSRNVQ